MKIGIVLIIIGLIAWYGWALSWEFKREREHKEYFEKVIKLLEAKEDIDIGKKLNLSEEGMRKYKEYLNYLQKEHPRKEYRRLDI